MACPFSLKIKFSVMKKIILSAAVLAFGFSFAQKKEVVNAYKAIESGDLTTANAQISAAEAILGDKTYLLEPEVLEQYLYTKGIALVKAGKTSEGAEVLAKISELGKSKIYTGKNAEKQKVYYVGKAAADASGISGLKEETYVPTTTPKIGTTVNPILNKINDETMKAYNAKSYAQAGKGFLEIYNLLKAAGSEDKQYKYYSALAFAQGNMIDESSKLFSELIAEGYTGVKTEFKAKNKKTGQEESLDKNTFELYKKMGAAGDYTDFKTESTPSIEQELFETAAALYVDGKKYDEALALIDKGLAKFPKSAKLSDLKGTTYFKSGKMDQFMSNLKEQVEKNPSDKVSWYNLGVLASKDPSKLAEAEGYFKKSLEIDPAYKEALQGVIFNIYINGDDKAIEAIDAARKAKKTELFNKLLGERRERFAKALPFAEKWYSVEPKNIEVVTLLKGLYQTTHNDVKFQEMKAVEAALKAGK